MNMKEWIQLDNFSKYEFCLSPLSARSKLSGKVFDGFELDKYNRKRYLAFILMTEPDLFLQFKEWFFVLKRGLILLF